MLRTGLRRVLGAALICGGGVSCGDGEGAADRPVATHDAASGGHSADAAPSGDLQSTGGLGGAGGALPPGPPPPSDPPCYSTCSESLELPDGGVRVCSGEGLMPGCLGTLVCTQGSCLPEGAPKPACQRDSECPDFQTCVSGGCYSTCEDDGTCEGASVCHRKVCRIPCSVADQACADGASCRVLDGATGFCMPSPPPVDVGEGTGGAAAGPSGLTFELSSGLLQFGPRKSDDTFTITNTSQTAARFSVRKKQQATFTDEGRVLELAQPLPWLRLGLAPGETAQVPAIEAELAAGETVTVYLSGAVTEAFPRWEGELQVVLAGADEKSVMLSYASLPSGRYTGTIHQFVQFNDRKLDEYIGASAAERAQKARGTENALLVKWTAFRQGTLTLDEVGAMLKATFDGSWAQQSTRTACAEHYGPGAVCYLYASGAPDDPGVRIFSDNAELRVPGGHIALPFGLILGTGGDALELTGRVESGVALQYPGNPPASLRFGSDPAACEDDDGAACLVSVAEFSASAVVGGRFVPGEAGCAAGAEPAGNSFELQSTPWLPTDFIAGTRLDEEGRRLKDECRESLFPLAPTTPDARFSNRAAAGGAPLPDGHARLRSLDLIDGVLANQTTLILLVRERFAGVSDEAGAKLAAYGIAVLEKDVADEPSAADLAPGLLPQHLTRPEDLLQLTCDPALVAELLGPAAELSGATAGRLARVLLDGTETGSAQVAQADPWAPHWLCEDTGRFDGGRAAWRDGRFDERCPPESRVTYFLLDTSAAPQDPSEDACQGGSGCPGEGVSCACSGADCEDRRGRCGQTLQRWVESGLARVHPPWACGENGVRNPGTVFCDQDRENLLSGKVFYAPREDAVDLQPLVPAIRQAFRYRTNFRGANGQTVGFVPAVCSPGGVDLNPYCYDPSAIEALAGRMDCLVNLWEGFGDALDLGTRTRVKQTLVEQYSEYAWPPRAPGVPVGPADPPRSEGFERLYAELLVMLADDDLTRAAASRFDVAGLSGAHFEGQRFEPGGPELAGGLGNQVMLLYRSLQRYDLALGRFHRLSGPLWRTMGSVDTNFVTQATATTYFNRLLRASTRRSEVVSDISEQYANLLQADLARGVIERGYTRTGLEATTLTQFIRRAAESLRGAERVQLESLLNEAALRYSVALRRMREGYDRISDERLIFGFAPDYVPFPVISGRQTSAVRVSLDQAIDATGLALNREREALELNRSVEGTAVQFQSELAKVRNQYENELAGLCGTLTGPAPDRRVVPAIPKYAELDPVALALGDPCGLMGHGQIFQAVGATDDARLGLRSALATLERTLDSVDLERQRAADECGGRDVIARVAFDAGGQVLKFETEARALRQMISLKKRDLAVLDRQVDAARAWIDLIADAAAVAAACIPALTATVPPVPIPINPARCGANVAAAAGMAGVAVATEIELQNRISKNEDITALERDIATKQGRIGSLQRDAAFATALQECCLDMPRSAQGCDHPGPLLVDSEARVDTLMLALQTGELNVLRADLKIRLAYAGVFDLRQRALRLVDQRSEAEQNLINVEAVRSDPNVRLTRNAAILDANKSFEDALEDAYRATRLVEYYTSQSYPHFDELLQARMVRGGEYGLENYVLDLDRFLRGFEEASGRPELRVAVVSLKDDLWQIPKQAADGTALGIEARADLFRARLADPGLLDPHGSVVIPFSTARDLASPLTRVHKIDHLEAELKGSFRDGQVGRLFLSQRGTGSIDALDESTRAYRFEPVTTVINPFFEGKKRANLDPKIYEDERFRDRPLLNTAWALGLDAQRAGASGDIDVRSVTDVILYLYYTDFVR